MCDIGRLNDFSDSRCIWLSIFYVLGLKLTYDLTKSPGQRITSIAVRCQECVVPKFEGLIPTKIYKIVASSMVLREGDKYKTIIDNLKHIKVGPSNFPAYRKFINTRSPIKINIENRIVIKN